MDSGFAFDSVQFCGICSAAAADVGTNSQTVLANCATAISAVGFEGSFTRKMPGTAGLMMSGKSMLVPVGVVSCTCTVPVVGKFDGTTRLIWLPEAAKAVTGVGIPLMVTETPSTVVAGKP